VAVEGVVIVVGVWEGHVMVLLDVRGLSAWVRHLILCVWVSDGKLYDSPSSIV
jgi:hypothetical protein